MRILITGKSGQVGYELRRTMGPLAPVIAVGAGEMPLQDTDVVRRTIRELRPSIIVNAAAYTAVDQAEEESDLAMAVNGVAPAVIASEMKRLGGAIIHYSTDYVFDGMKQGAYTEEDDPQPLSVYGKTKLAGDEGIRGSGVPHLIFRMGWIYGARGRNFLRTILKLAASGRPIRIVNDQWGAPTWSRMIAEVTALVLAKTGVLQRPGALDAFSGIYNIAAAGATSWHGFAEAVLADAPEEIRERSAHPAPITTGEFPTKARRPANSRLDCSKIRDAFGITLPDWRESSALVMEELKDFKSQLSGGEH